MATYTIVLVNFIVFTVSLFFRQDVIGELGFRPIYLSADFFPQLYTAFTSMFLHGDFFHILMNMLIFFFIGLSFEQRIGRNKFFIIYFITGVCGTVAYSLLNLGSTTVLIGASGAVFGILGAYASAFPRDEVVMPIPLPIMIFTRMKVVTAAVMFAAVETVYFMFFVADNVAHIAHLGGLVSGIILAAILIRNETKSASHHNMQSRNKTDFVNLRRLAITEEQKRMLKTIEKETVPEVRRVWFDHFLETVRCSNCGKSLSCNFKGKIWCKNCGFNMKY
jgi:membrane associated rhomboid family serine protease